MKKEWKRKTLTQVICFLIIAIICVLCYITSDNQLKAWKADKNDTMNFTSKYHNEGYIKEEANEKRMVEIALEQAATIQQASIEDNLQADKDGQVNTTPPTREQEVDASTVGSTLAEPRVVSSSSNSPDNKYCAETYGVNENVTAGGFYPSKEIRIRELSSDEILWSMMGYYSCEFFWTSDSRHLAISYVARIYGETIIIDMKDFSEVLVPLPEQVQEDLREFRPDTYIHAIEWTDDDSLSLQFSYVAKDEAEYFGNYTFTLSTGEVSKLKITEER